MEKVGVKELKDVVALAVGLANAGALIAKDKKISIDDVQHLFAVVPLVGPAVEGITQLPSELMDLSTEEGAEVVAHVASSMMIGDEKAKAIVLASLKLAMAGKDLVLAITEQPKVVA